MARRVLLPRDMSKTAEIVAVMSVVDTRQYVEDGDRFVPVAGSGESHACDRCGRGHEVHATVRLADDTTAIVGVSCMREKEMAKEARRQANGAGITARLRAELAKNEALLARLVEAQKAAESMTAPEVEVRALDDRRGEYRCGDAWVWRFGSDEEKGRADAVREWRRKRVYERVACLPEVSLRGEIDRLRERLEARRG